MTCHSLTLHENVGVSFYSTKVKRNKIQIHDVFFPFFLSFLWSASVVLVSNVVASFSGFVFQLKWKQSPKEATSESISPVSPRLYEAVNPGVLRCWFAWDRLVPWDTLWQQRWAPLKPGKEFPACLQLACGVAVNREISSLLYLCELTDSINRGSITLSCLAGERFRKIRLNQCSEYFLLPSNLGGVVIKVIHSTRSAAYSFFSKIEKF